MVKRKMKLTNKNKKELTDLFIQSIESMDLYMKEKKKFVKEMYDKYTSDYKYLSKVEKIWYLKSLEYHFDWFFFSQGGKIKNMRLRMLRYKSIFYSFITVFWSYIPLFLFAFIGHDIIQRINEDYFLYAMFWQLSLFIGFIIYFLNKNKIRVKKELDDLMSLAKKPIGRWGK